jgi:hypothetical protein
LNNSFKRQKKQSKLPPEDQFLEKQHYGHQDFQKQIRPAHNPQKENYQIAFQTFPLYYNIKQFVERQN